MASKKPSPLVARVRAALEAVADPARAPRMQAYMKSAMPYHGVASPVFKKVAKVVFPDIDLSTPALWRAAVLDLWHHAEYREERYAALALVHDRRARAYLTAASLPLLEELIVTGAWWDLVDDVATHALGRALAAEPEKVGRVLREWSLCPDLWKRRSAITAQVGRKAETDLDLLYACIEPALGEKEFFLRKAIGWALRAYAWTDPREVIRYVRANAGRLSPLSKKEALKNVSKAGLVDRIPQDARLDGRRRPCHNDGASLARDDTRARPPEARNAHGQAVPRHRGGPVAPAPRWFGRRR